MNTVCASHCVLVTGAASGIGLGIARALAAAGHRLVLTDLDPAACESQVVALREQGAAARGHALDVADAAAIERVVAACADDPPLVLINNAGLQHVAPLEDFPPQRWQQLIAVMLTGTAMMTRALLPAMRARGFGRIVNIGSIHSLVASPFKSAYVAAKHGLVGLSKVVALETADVDVTINTLCPSYVFTPLVDAQIDAQARVHGLSRDRVIDEIMLRPMPKKRFIGIDELAGTVEFLLSPAARNITAQCIALDGGWTAQ
jgi:3-hydroxybutyrate dehydrogenase